MNEQTKNKALCMLDRRDYSRAELTKKLTEKGESQQDALFEAESGTRRCADHGGRELEIGQDQRRFSFVLADFVMSQGLFPDVPVFAQEARFDGIGQFEPVPQGRA